MQLTNGLRNGKNTFGSQLDRHMESGWVEKLITIAFVYGTDYELDPPFMSFINFRSI